MSNPVLKGASYVLIHTPEMIIHNGTTQTSERITNPDSEYLKNIINSFRTFEEVVSYPPNQTYIGNMTTDELKKVEFPYYDKKVDFGRFSKRGEIMPEIEFIGLLQAVDVFELVKLEENFVEKIKVAFAAHKLLEEFIPKLKGTSLAEIEKDIADHGEPIAYEGKVVGSVKRAHDIDVNLNAHVMFENLVVKASGVIALKNLFANYNINPNVVDYVIECSEEACGDMNQRGGGNFAKSIAEMCGCTNATGSDTRGFCAAPTHALIQAASLVKAGTYKNVVVVAGGATAKLGMNGKDHVKKGVPILEDVVGGFATLISEDDFKSPVFNTDIVGRHTVGTGSAPQAVITSLVATPLKKAGLKITDVDKFSVEMQNPDITKPAGAGDVPEANYKMIAALAVLQQEIERGDIAKFIEEKGMVGCAPTQGHIPSGVPYLGEALGDLTTGSVNKALIIGKGSLFLGRMTNLFDGVSIMLERNKGQVVEQKVATNGKLYRIGVTNLGSEHGIDNIVKGAEIASKESNEFEVVVIGQKCNTNLEVVEVASESDAHKKMEELLDSGYLDGCVTMHYNFPIGVSTVGRVVTPMGNEMLVGTTTGTSDTERVLAMVKNAVYSIATAKALGIANPTVGVLNLDGARNVEIALNKLKENGYDFSFSSSVRADGGAVMRGNDLIVGNVDCMVSDTLTGNILMKMFSSFTTGGSYEAVGYGYGAGVGEGYNKLVSIISRASGTPVVAKAIVHTFQLAKGNFVKVAREEIDKAINCGLNDVVPKKVAGAAAEVVEKPPVEVVTGQVSGVDVMDLDSAVSALWKEKIYAESGMGCTGPIVLVPEGKIDLATEILVKAGFVSK
ncbi:MAG: glycine/sarcosine/betaine reductase complex component C subunit beta [Lachnospirales bacterium]